MKEYFACIAGYGSHLLILFIYLFMFSHFIILKSLSRTVCKIKSCFVNRRGSTLYISWNLCTSLFSRLPPPPIPTALKPQICIRLWPLYLCLYIQIPANSCSVTTTEAKFHVWWNRLLWYELLLLVFLLLIIS